MLLLPKKEPFPLVKPQAGRFRACIDTWGVVLRADYCHVASCGSAISGDGGNQGFKIFRDQGFQKM